MLIACRNAFGHVIKTKHGTTADPATEWHMLKFIPNWFGGDGSAVVNVWYFSCDINVPALWLAAFFRVDCRWITSILNFPTATTVLAATWHCLPRSLAKVRQTALVLGRPSPTWWRCYMLRHRLYPSTTSCSWSRNSVAAAGTCKRLQMIPPSLTFPEQLSDLDEVISRTPASTENETILNF